MLLAPLSLLVLVAAASVVARAKLGGRGERALAIALSWNALVLAPIHLLGVTDSLTKPNLAWLSLLLSSLVIGASFFGADRRAHADAIGDELIAFARVPWDALVACVRERSFAVVGVFFAIAAIVWTAWLSYLLPAESWDGTWYHELMVGYAIQNHGYAPADLPQHIGYPNDMIQQANGFPKNCEMTWLWFVMLFDGRLLEITNSLVAAPVLALATYVMARRFGGSRALAMGWAAAMVLVPCAALQLRSTYMDVHVAAFYLGALALATREELRLRDAWLACVALALLVGAKSHGLIHVPSIAAVLAARLLWSQRARLGAAMATLAGGAALIFAVASITYLHNWRAFHNPFWPLAFDGFGMHFEGLARLEQFTGNKPASEMWTGATSFRTPGADFADTGDWAWGWTTAFFLLPLSAAGCAVAVARAPWDSKARIAVALALPLAVTIATAHTLWHPRYNLHLLAGMMVLTHYLLAQKAPRFVEGLVGATVFGNLLFLYWAKPGWGADWDQARRVAAMSVDRRCASYTLGWSPSAEAAFARERELGAGDVVVFAEDMMFPAYLWNRAFSNRVVYVKHTSARAWLSRADELGAKWAVAGEGGDVHAALAASAGWERVGVMARAGATVVAFRRVR